MEVAREILDLLREIEDVSEYRAFLCGGYLRDTFMGVRPKDLDIMLVPSSEDVDPESEIDEVVWGVRPPLFKEDKRLECIEYLSDMVKRGVCGLIMGESESCGYETQFIIYDKVLTQKELAVDMDMNICQITCNSSGGIYSTDAFTSGLENKQIQVLHDYSEKRRNQRIERMLAKYPDFTVLTV